MYLTHPRPPPYSAPSAHYRGHHVDLQHQPTTCAALSSSSMSSLARPHSLFHNCRPYLRDVLLPTTRPCEDDGGDAAARRKGSKLLRSEQVRAALRARGETAIGGRE